MYNKINLLITKLIVLTCIYCHISYSQSTFTFGSYTAGAFTYTNTQNGYSMTTSISTTGTPGWFNLTGGQSPNYGTYSPSSCSSSGANLTGLWLATNRTSVASDVLMTINFSPAVCGPVKFNIYDLNGANNSFCDYVTISAWDNNNNPIALTTGMVNTNGATSCNGGHYGNYITTSGNSLVVIGCSYNDCGNDAFTIPAASGMVSKITIDYASGGFDWNGATISDPALQYIVISNITAYTPSLTVTGVCPAGTLKATETLFSSNPTYAWTANAAVFGAGPSTTTNTAAGTTSTVSYVTTTTSNVFTVTASITGCSVTTTTTMANDFCITLPVELSSFSSRCTGAQKTFNWSTATEKNNQFFTLEKSKDGENFEPLTKISGSGTSTKTRTYSYTYSEEQSEYKYYRLKQTDFNGSTKILKVAYSNCVDAVGSLKLTPNPANKEVNVEFEASQESVFTINVIDLMGRIVKSTQYAAIEGSNQMQVDIQDLLAGSYYVSIANATGSRPQILKFIKSIE